MSNRVTKGWIAVVALMLAHVAVAQNRPTNSAAASPYDVAIQHQAENVPAEILLAEKLLASQRPAEALAWYRKAAEKRNVEAYYRIGGILLNGVSGPEGQDVSADPAAGVRWTYRAATNLHAKAMLNLARALECGLGTKTNLIEACAWMQLSAERDPVSGRAEWTNLTSRLDAATIREGGKLAKQFRDRQWSNLSIMKLAGLASALKLEGVSLGGGNPLAIINRRTLAKGESAEIRVKGGTIQVKCLAIEEETVLVEVAGEDEPRLLRFDQRFAASGGK